MPGIPTRDDHAMSGDEFIYAYRNWVCPLCMGIEGRHDDRCVMVVKFHLLGERAEDSNAHPRELAAMLGCRDYDGLVGAVVANRSTPCALLMVVAIRPLDEDWSMHARDARRNLQSHRRSTQDLLHMFLFGNVWERAAAVINDNCPDVLLASAHQDQESLVRAASVMNSHATVDMLQQSANDPSPLVRYFTAVSPIATAAVLCDIAQHCSEDGDDEVVDGWYHYECEPSTVYALTIHPNFSEDVLVCLLRNSDLSVDGQEIRGYADADLARKRGGSARLTSARILAAAIG